MNEALKQAIESAFLEKGMEVNIEMATAKGGGSINDAFVLQSNEGPFFLKVNSASKYPLMFQREAEGLKALHETGLIRIPEPILFGEIDDTAFIVMEYLESGSPGPHFWDEFGKRMAELHKVSAENFGFENDNYIGSLPQSNTRHATWAEFFIHERLEVLVKKARDMGQFGSETVRRFDKLYSQLENFFPEEKPSLIHGDLWGGNYLSDSYGKPTIFDPAVYYGHREMDIGMSKLFGGFTSQFYDVYNEYYPMESGWKSRMDVANLYPLLVHVILFGEGYARDVERILKRF